MKNILVIAGVLSLLTFGACTKSGELIKAVEVVDITISGFSTNANAAFAVVVNDELVEDSLFNGQTTSKLIAKTDGMQHIMVKDHFTDATLIDTSFTIPDKTARLTLLQLDPDIAPILVGATDETIPDNYRQQAFFYTTDILPDSIGCQIYAAHYDANTFELMKIDTLVTYEKIKRGVLSEFRMIKENTDPSTIFYFFQPLEVNTLRPMANIAMPFDPANYSGYQFPFEEGPAGTEKLYINNIGATGSPAFFDVNSGRLISY